MHIHPPFDPTTIVPPQRYVGYSTGTGKMVTSSVDAGLDMVQFLLGWRERFPEHAHRSFILASESYGACVVQLSSCVFVLVLSCLFCFGHKTDATTAPRVGLRERRIVRGGGVSQRRPFRWRVVSMSPGMLSLALGRSTGQAGTTCRRGRTRCSTTTRRTRTRR